MLCICVNREREMLKYIHGKIQWVIVTQFLLLLSSVQFIFTAVLKWLEMAAIRQLITFPYILIKIIYDIYIYIYMTTFILSWQTLFNKDQNGKQKLTHCGLVT